MTFKEKQILIDYLFVLAYRNQNGLMVQEGKKSLSQILEGALSRLSPEERLIIENDFISKKDKLWYLDYFSRSTYYRIKKHSMTTFLNCLGL